MFKNTASQKLTVLAFADAGHASLDAGEPVTGDAAQITCKVEQDDDGTQSATNDANPTEVEDGQYRFDLTQAETNGDKLTFYPESSTAGVQVVCLPSNVIYTRPPNFPNLGIESDGMAHSDVKEWKGSAPADLADTDKVPTSVRHMADDVMTAAAAAADFGAELAALVETYIVNEGDATAVMQAIADVIAQDWVQGDATPLAIVAALKADAEWSDLSDMASKLTTVDKLLDAMFHGWGTIAAITDDDTFVVAGANIPTTSAAIKGTQMVVIRHDNPLIRQTRRVTDWDDNTSTVSLLSEGSIAQVGNFVFFPSQLVFSGTDNTKQILRTDVSGYVGINLADVGNPTTVLDLPNLTIKGVNDAVTLTAAERIAVANAHFDLADAVESGYTYRESERLSLSAIAGKASGGDTNTMRYRDINDSKDRITATVDENGNRSALTYDAS